MDLEDVQDHSRPLGESDTPLWLWLPIAICVVLAGPAEAIHLSLRGGDSQPCAVHPALYRAEVRAIVQGMIPWLGPVVVGGAFAVNRTHEPRGFSSP